MAVREFGKEFTKSDTLKSALLFFVHFVIFVAIAMFLVVGMEIKNFSDHLRVNGANYLYALFSIFLLIAIMYFYFYFENKTMLSNSAFHSASVTSGRNIFRVERGCI